MSDFTIIIWKKEDKKNCTDLFLQVWKAICTVLFLSAAADERPQLFLFFACTLSAVRVILAVKV